MKIFTSMAFIRLALLALTFFTAEITWAQLEVPDDMDEDDIIEAGKGGVGLFFQIIQVVIGAGICIFGIYQIIGSYAKYQEERIKLPEFALQFFIVIIIVAFCLFLDVKMGEYAAAL